MDEQTRTLICAAKHGDNKLITKFIADGLNLNGKDEYGNQAIHTAAISNQKEVIEALLNSGKVSVDTVNDAKNTALYIAVCCGHFSLIEFLVSKNANCNIADTNHETPLHCAFDKLYCCCVRDKALNCKSKAKLRKCTFIEKMYEEKSQTLGTKCVWHAAIKFLITNGNADLTIKNNSGKGAIDYIPEEDMYERYNFQMFIADDEENLCKAAESGNVNLVKSLIIAGINVARRNSEGLHAIHAAAMGGKTDVIKFLLTFENVHVEIEDRSKMTPIHYAIENDQIATIELFVLKHANCNYADNSGFSPMHKAIRKLLLCCLANDTLNCKEKAKLNDCDAIRKTFEHSRMLRTQCVWFAVIQLLMEKGNADIITANSNGLSPLDCLPKQYLLERHFLRKIHEFVLYKNSYFGTFRNEELIVVRILRENREEIRRLLANVDSLQHAVEDHGYLINQQKISHEELSSKFKDENETNKKRFSELALRTVAKRTTRRTDTPVENKNKEVNDLKAMLKDAQLILNKKSAECSQLTTMVEMLTQSVKQLQQVQQTTNEEIDRLQSRVKFLELTECCESCKEKVITTKALCGRMMCDECFEAHHRCNVCAVIRKFL